MYITLFGGVQNKIGAAQHVECVETLKPLEIAIGDMTRAMMNVNGRIASFE